ncbi:hypothetical protein Bca101_003767 [Brassica carinata]
MKMRPLKSVMKMQSLKSVMKRLKVARLEGEASVDECIDSEAELFEKSESDDDVEVVEEEIEVFKDVNYEEQISDEDEQYPTTDDSSGDEEEQAERLVKRNMFSQ